MSQPKAIAVFGAAGAVGSAVCRLLSKRLPDYEIHAIDSDEAALKALAGEISGLKTCCLDCTDPVKTCQCIEDCSSKVNLWGAVNCIGDLVVRPLTAMQDYEFEEILRINVLTSFNILKGCLKAMTKQGGGSLVCVSGAAAYHGFKNHEAWGAAKAAVVGMHKSAAAKYCTHKIRINCVAPSLIKHSGAATESPQQLAEMEKKVLPMYPLGRLAEPEDVAEAICFLLHPTQSAFMTGTNIPVDGGLTNLLPATMVM